MIIDNSCTEFVNVLASKAPAPGGGGASALCGAIGSALGNMVGSLTFGKKKYKDVEEDIMALMKESEELQQELLKLVDRDAEVFEPLAKAYSLPKETPDEIAEKERVMEACLKDACQVPIDIMKACAKAIRLCGEYAEKGSRLALSDAGCGAILCKSALQAASLNVFINTGSMKNAEMAKAFEAEADALLCEYTDLADKIFDQVTCALRK